MASEQLSLELEDTTRLEDKIPAPVGYRLLVELPKTEETFTGSQIIKTHKELNHDQVLSFVGRVIDMGQEAYSDKDRFPSGPWCKVGDYVIFRTNTGTRFKLGDTEFRLMNDDSIEAVVADPSALKRPF
jgi:co-chaperonin GroES (HSP10)